MALMPGQPVSSVVMDILADLQHLLAFMNSSAWQDRQGDPSISDFVFGNPHEMPIPELSEALQTWSVPRDPNWFAYKFNEPEAVKTVVRSLTQQRGVEFQPDDVFLTTGAFAGLLTCLRVIVEPGDEVIFISPPWFFYGPLIKMTGGRYVRVHAEPPAFELPVDRIRDAMSDRTRAVIVNTPNNPSGRIYRGQELDALAQVLRERSEANGRTVYLISDEAYCKIVYDDRRFESPTEHYDASFLVYTYGKTLLTPGARMGYIALPPTMPEREMLRMGIFLAQAAGGWLFPNAVLQYAIADLEPLSIDVGHLQEKRDRLCAALSEMGYEVTVPEGTFYVMVRSPWEDDEAFSDLLTTHDIFVLPGAIVELPGFFRISLTASDDMIERALQGFEVALKEASRGGPPPGA
jgi:aspartate aminotransferase